MKVLAAVVAALVSSGLAVTAATSALTASATAADPAVTEGPVGTLPTRPVLVDAIGDPGDAAGSLVVEPAAILVTLREGRAVQPELYVLNGGGVAVDLRLEARAVTTAADGAPVIGDGDLPASVTLELPASTVHLEPGERATLWPTLTDAAAERGSTVAVAIVAATGEAAPAAIIVADPPPARAGVGIEVTATGGSSPSATVELDARGNTSDLLEGTLEIRSWTGATTEVAIPPTLVLGGTQRQRTVSLHALLPGPYEVDARLSGQRMRILGGGTTVWLWPRPAVLIVATCVAVVALVLIVLIIRARRRGLPSPVPSGDQEPADGG